MEIFVKKLNPEAVIPTSAHETDAGYDLVAINDGTWTDTYVEYDTGLSIQPEPGYHVEIFPRSSISKTDLVLANSIGLIDESYRGPILLRFKCTNPQMFTRKSYKKGDKIGQLVIRKTERAKFTEVSDLIETQRGAGGFGSTGN
jgi:dUTP pyrophosphatase